MNSFQKGLASLSAISLLTLAAALPAFADKGGKPHDPDQPVGKPASHGDVDRGHSESKGHNDAMHPAKVRVLPMATPAPGFGHGRGKALGLKKHPFNGGKPFKGTVTTVLSNQRVTVLLPNGTTQTFYVSGPLALQLKGKIGTPVLLQTTDGTHLVLL